jgi:hypothetical protein
MTISTFRTLPKKLLANRPTFGHGTALKETLKQV